MTGDTLQPNLTSDGSVVYYGFQVDRYEIFPDVSVPVQGVIVTLAPGQLSTQTGADGVYSFGGLTPGAYTVTPEFPGAVGLNCTVVLNSCIRQDFVEK